MGVKDRNPRYQPKADSMGAHARVYDQIAHSPAWSALNFTSRALYVQLRIKLKGSNDGDIDATITNLRHAGFRSPSTLSRALRELTTVGLIAKTRQGGIAAGGKKCSLYRFTDKETWEIAKAGVPQGPPSHEWRQWTNVKAAEAAIRDAHQAARRAPKTDGKIRKA